MLKPQITYFFYFSMNNIKSESMQIFDKISEAHVWIKLIKQVLVLSRGSFDHQGVRTEILEVSLLILNC